MPLERADHAREVRSALTDPKRFCVALGLTDGAKPNGDGLLIRCPSHGDRDPSCSVTRGPDGTIRAVCFACDFKTDALGVIAVVRGLNLRSRDDFREALAEAASIAGLTELEQEILDGKPKPNRPRVQPPEPRDERAYVPTNDLAWVWAESTSVQADPDVREYLFDRGLNISLVDERRLARVIPEALPRWARYQGRSWTETGHRMVIRAFDPDGKLRALRACRVTDGDTPKRLPPAGHRSSGLAMLNEAAHRMCRGETFGRVGIVEGEPDFLTWATKSNDPIIGLYSGSWTNAWAATIPQDARVYVRTHDDDAGDRYAQKVIDSLAHKCHVFRTQPEAA